MRNKPSLQRVREYAHELHVKRATIDDVQAALPSGSALILLKRYRPVVDFAVAGLGEEAYVSVLVLPGEPLRLVQLGAARPIDQRVEELADLDERAAKKAAAALYRELFGSLNSFLLLI